MSGGLTSICTISLKYKEFYKCWIFIVFTGKVLLVLLFFKTRLGGIIKPNVSKSKLNHKRCKKPCSFLPPGTFRGSTEVREPRYNPRTKTGIWINRSRWVSLQMRISRSLGGLIYLLHSNMNSALKKSCKIPCSDFFLMWNWRSHLIPHPWAASRGGCWAEPHGRRFSESQSH